MGGAFSGLDMGTTMCYTCGMNREDFRAGESELGTMECFLLALIEKARMKSLYEFRQRVGLEPGGILPALKRLEQWGLIIRAKAGRRRRRELELTAEGESVLRQQWTSCLRPYPDSESILRAGFVSLLMAGPGHCAMYLEYMGTTLNARQEQLTMQSEFLESRHEDPLDLFAWMRITTEARRRQAESEALLSIARLLTRRETDDN